MYVTLIVLTSVVITLFVSRDSKNTISTKQERKNFYEVINSKAQKQNKVIYTTGNIKAKNSVDIIINTTGIIKSINAQSGDFLKAGQSILTIDPEDKELIVEQRKRELYRSEIEFDAVKALRKKHLSSDTELARVRAQLSGAKASLERAQVELQKTKVAAPFDGYIESISSSVGDYVSNSSNNKVIGRFIALHSIFAETKISEIDRMSISNGDEALITFRDNRKTIGTVNFCSMILDKQSKSFPVEISINNKDAQYFPGQNIKVELLLKQELTHEIPHSAIALNEHGDIGVKVISDNKIAFKKIHIVKESTDKIWVGGLDLEENIIWRGHTYLKSGDTV